MPKSNNKLNDRLNDISRGTEDNQDAASKSTVSDDMFRKDGQNRSEIPHGMKIIEKKKAIVKEIIYTLYSSSDAELNYSPEATVKAIKEYIHNDETNERILYSPITTSIFALDKISGIDINGNLQVLIEYIGSELKNDTDYNKLMDFVMRIYDHVQLAESQQKVIQDATNRSKNEIKNELQNTRQQAVSEFGQKLNDEARASQRGYVATLGIFASIIVAIFSNLTLTKSIIDNFHEGLLTIILLSTMAGTFVIIIVHMLLSAVGNMLDKKIEGIATGNYILAFWVVSFICLLLLAKVGN